jgi:hypothetical protein
LPSIEQIQAAVQEHGSVRAAARDLGLAESTLRGRLKNAHKAPESAGPEKSGATINHERGEATLVSTPADNDGEDVEQSAVDELIRENGLDPDEWIVTTTTLNRWTALGAADKATGVNPVHIMRQVKVTLRQRSTIELLLPAVHVPPVAGRIVRPWDGESPRLAVILSDPHAPYVDAKLNACVEKALRDIRPDVGVMNGDIGDYPTLSRHKRNPKYNASPAECVQGSYEWVRGKVEAAPEAEWFLDPGNHDQRLRDYALAHAPESYGLAPASIDGSKPKPETLGDVMRRVMHLDALGVTMVAPDEDGEYFEAEVRLAERFGVRHGTGSGKDHAKKSLDRRGYSFAYGHDHRMATTYTTRWDHDGPKQLVAIGTGCLCRVERSGLGYMGDPPDWQQGFATVVLYPDGRFHVEHAVYTGGSLYWRNQRWTA